MHSLFRNSLLVGWLTFGFVLCTDAVRGAEEEPKSASDVTPKTTKITGVFEAIVSHELSADTEQVESFKIKRILPHGTKVSKGQNVVWLETEDIDKKIKDAEIDMRLLRLTMEDDEFGFKQFLETQKLDRAAAERARKYAQQDYDNFVQVDRDRDKVVAEFNLMSSRDSLENAMEELEQLEQMYKEDDLTEASEEIVLKRAKRSVEFAQYRLDGTEIQSERAVKQSIPRSAAQHEESFTKAELAYEKALRELTSTRQRRDVELNRKRDKFKDEEKKLAELKAERKRVVLTSPCDGIVLHGELSRGKLGDKPSVLKPGSKVTSQQILTTVVNPTMLQIRVDLEEQHLAVATLGAQSKVTLKAFPEFEAVGTVKSVSAVPYAATKYDCVVTFRQTKQQPAIQPTMTCELEFESEKEGADDAKHKDKK